MGFLAAVGAAASAYSAIDGMRQRRRAQSQMEQAQRDSLAQHEQQLSAMQQEFNKANPKRPSRTSRYMSAAQAGRGNYSTMLTGPTGVDPSTLSLGKSTLLGQ